MVDVVVENVDKQTDEIVKYGICVIVAVASGVAAITPTPKDDHWFRHVYMLVDWCALNIWKAKDK